MATWPGLSRATNVSVFMLGIAPAQVWDLALGSAELHGVCTGPTLKPVKGASLFLFLKLGVMFSLFQSEGMPLNCRDFSKGIWNWMILKVPCPVFL